MSLLDQLDDGSIWREFLEYKLDRGTLSKDQAQDFTNFVENQEYLGVVARIREGQLLTPPKKKLVSKTDSSKKRTLYVFCREENYVLKLLTYLAIRRYDHTFSPQLFSFRARTDSKRAIMSLVRRRGISKMHSFKIDVSDYFGSVDVARLLPMLQDTLEDDPELYGFFARVLTDDRTNINGEIVLENKGIMAGSPISTFFANVYLGELDRHFDATPYPYARYSDDIMVFAPTQAEIEECERYIWAALEEKGLSANPKKVMRTEPRQQWTFLGISFRDGIVDISPVSALKLKKKMRRRARSILRWRARKNVSYENAAKAFIRALNRKLFEGSSGNDLTWTRWFFPLINTDKTLHEIDAYMQDCIRYVATGKRNKGRFEFRYEDMKTLGYRSLVHEYYDGRKEAESAD